MKKKTAGIWLTIGILVPVLVAGFVTRTLPTKEEKLAEMQASYDQEVAMAERQSESIGLAIDLEGQEQVPAAPSTDGTSVEDETSAQEAVTIAENSSELQGNLLETSASASKVALGETNRAQKVAVTTKAPVTTAALVVTTKTQSVTEGAALVSESETTAAPTTTSGSWVQQQIDANRDEINDADLEEGMAIFNKLDTGYLFDLADGGLTDGEKAAVNAYLDNTLAPGERDKAMQLYNKYIHLLE